MSASAAGPLHSGGTGRDAPVRSATRLPWIAAGAVACGCVAVSLIDPTTTPLTPPCPFRSATGWWCPLCGGTRAVSRLVRGDLGGAWRYNAALVTLVPVALVLWLMWAVPDRLGALAPLRRGARGWVVALAVGLVAFTVVRNLPFAADALRYPGA